MSPSQIVKSAYAAARKEGYTHSIKVFAQDLAGVSGHGESIQVSRDGHNLNSACKQWLANKAAQRKQARQCARSARRGHTVVHEQQHARSVANSLAGSMPMRGGHS